MTDFTKVEADITSLINAASAPLKTQVATLKTQVAALQAQVADLTAKLAACVAQLPAPPPPPPPPPPTGGNTDPKVPPAGGWPDASNTGATGTLTAYAGSLTISAAGSVIENKIINGVLTINAGNVTIRNCRLVTNGFWGIDASANAAAGLVVERCTIIGQGVGGTTDSGIVGSGAFTGNNISAFENGIRLQDGASTVKGNFIHDLGAAGADPHYDGIHVQGGQNGVLIEDNTVMGRDTSDIIIQDYYGPVNDVTVNHNNLGGTPAFDVYVEGRFGNGTTNVKVTNNLLRKGVYGYFSIDTASPLISGNIDAVTSAPANA